MDCQGWRYSRGSRSAAVFEPHFDAFSTALRRVLPPAAAPGRVERSSTSAWSPSGSCGLIRRPSQTQREFAREAGLRLAASPHLKCLAGLPATIADAFYQVRFGGRPLDGDRAEAIAEALLALERADWKKEPC